MSLQAACRCPLALCVSGALLEGQIRLDRDPQTLLCLAKDLAESAQSARNPPRPPLPPLALQLQTAVRLVLTRDARPGEGRPPKFEVAAERQVARGLPSGG